MTVLVSILDGVIVLLTVLLLLKGCHWLAHRLTEENSE